MKNLAVIVIPSYQAERLKLAISFAINDLINDTVHSLQMFLMSAIAREKKCEKDAWIMGRVSLEKAEARIYRS